MAANGNRIAGVILVVGLAVGQLPAASRESGRTFLFQAGAGAEYFTRSLAWDDDSGSSVLAAGLGLVRFGVVFSGGPELALLAGYGRSDWTGLVFRQLPFSLDYQAGFLGSPVVGAEAEIPLFTAGPWELGAGGQILFSLGSSGSWTLSDLAETGRLDGKGRWTRVQLGPTVTYRGFETFSPYVSVYYDGLWGTFTMNEAIGTLSGSEEKKVRGQGVFGASFGLEFEPSSALRLKAEGSLVSFEKLEGGLSIKAGASLQARILF